MAEDENQPAIILVKVTNNLDRDISDWYNGVPVVFPVGVPVEVNTEIAAHIFGWPGDDDDRARHMANRFGWGTRENLQWMPGTRRPMYFADAMKIVIEPVPLYLTRRKPSDPIPADDGGKDDDPPPPAVEADTGTKVGRRRKTAKRRDRHSASERVR
ncbi:MAG TPA: hypothetical protein VF748_17685 [Candidatus Acidoferrum sp.]